MCSSRHWKGAMLSWDLALHPDWGTAPVSPYSTERLGGDRLDQG